MRTEYGIEQNIFFRLNIFSIHETFKGNFGEHQHFSTEKSGCWFYYIIFFMAKLFMLQDRVVSNSMIDFVLGHFSLSFC